MRRCCSLGFLTTPQKIEDEKKGRGHRGSKSATGARIVSPDGFPTTRHIKWNAQARRELDVLTTAKMRIFSITVTDLHGLNVSLVLSGIFHGKTRCRWRQDDSKFVPVIFTPNSRGKLLLSTIRSHFHFMSRFLFPVPCGGKAYFLSGDSSKRAQSVRLYFHSIAQYS